MSGLGPTKPAYMAPLTCPTCGGEAEHLDVIESSARRSSASLRCTSCGAIWALVVTLRMVAPPTPLEGAA